jgi:RHS repeat-associated protein
MAGISSKAAGKLENKRKFNDGTELTSDLGLEFYETPFRSYDAQLGRFHQIDALSDLFKSLNPYVFAFNHPTRFNDPTGLIVPTKPDLSAGKAPDQFDLKPNVPVLAFPSSNSTEGINNLPQEVNFYVFNSGPLATPQTYNHIKNAISNGAPSELTYNSNKQDRKLNRLEASDFHMDLYSIDKGSKCFPGYWMDEYPFACTSEGGASSYLSTKCVPAFEQILQGSMLGGIIKMNSLKTGDKINIVLIGDDDGIPRGVIPLAPGRFVTEVEDRMSRYINYRDNLGIQNSMLNKNPNFLYNGVQIGGLVLLIILAPELSPGLAPLLQRYLPLIQK